MAQVHSAAPWDKNGVVCCHVHRLAARLLTSYTEKNPNKKFYVCAKDRGDPDRCDFFVWADDPRLQGRPLPQPSPPSPSNTPSRAPEIMATPRKREAAPPTPEPTPSQKRRRIIEETLSQSSVPASSRQKTPELRQGPNTPRPEPTTLTQSTSDRLLDPPTGHTAHAQIKTEEEIPTKDPEMSSSPRAQLDANGTLVGLSQAAQGLQEERPESSTETFEITSESMLFHVEALPEHVHRLERKLRAAEKSIEAKTRWIERLEEENRMLRKLVSRSP